MTLYMVELTVADLTRSVAWYRDVCGLAVQLVDEPNGFALMACHPPPGSRSARPDLPLKGGGVSNTSPLEGEVVNSGGVGGWGVERGPPTKLALKRGTPPTDGGVRLHFLVPDLTAELARLAALGVTPESDLKTSPEGYRRAAFRDPDGHPVTLFEWVRPHLV